MTTTCPFSLFCYTGRAPFLHDTFDIFLCPNCEKVIYTYTKWNSWPHHSYIYAFFCHRRKLNPLIKQHWSEREAIHTIKDTITDSLLTITECAKCHRERDGSSIVSTLCTRIDFDNKDTLCSVHSALFP